MARPSPCGCLTPSVTVVPITIEVIDERVDVTRYHTVTNSDGCFNFTQQKP
ncbi:MAG: hypothetical protein JWN47_2021 [Frankiales bacterium]|nr:hypothetical protein [Frankiales bacterium]